ncbi:YraN family protein [Vibrio sp. AK197]|uniref:UPF0102 protein ACFFUV_09505 n=1 Tax=Vibrio olivae TaxID=1243002 RepID=A0ABV5HLS6_9VIBR
MKLFSRRATGQAYEAAAEKYLQGCGLVIIERNFQVRGGELDLIMRDGTTTVFVEVRYRNSQQYGHAAETVTPAKIKRLMKTATLWLMKQGLSVHSTDFRFDLVAIHQQGKQIEWIKNVITQG